MIESCIEDLKTDCKDIESWIEIEKSKLTVLRSELEDFANNDDVRIEKSKIRKREKQIEKEQANVQSLLSECNALLKVIATVEKDSPPPTTPGIEGMQSSLEQVIADIELSEDEIYKTEEKIRLVKEKNSLLEKEWKRKILLDQSDADKERERFMMDSRSRRMENLLSGDVALGTDDLETLKTALSSNPDDKDISGYLEKVRQLRVESEELYKELLSLKKDKEEYYNMFEREHHKMLNQMTDEITKAEGDIADLELELQDVMSDLEKVEDAVSKDEKIEEEEAKFTLEDLQRNLKKTKNELTKLRLRLKTVQTQCNDEEKRNNDIMLDLQQFEKFSEKMRKEEEKAFRAIASEKAS